MNEDHHAVVIGIDTYPGFTSLRGACNDARAMTAWLTDPEGGALPAENVETVLTSDFHPPGPDGVDDARPFDIDLKTPFRDWIRRGKADPHVAKRFYIFMAGHGFSVADVTRASSTAVYSANSDHAIASHIVATAYAEWFRLNAVFEEIVLVLDCCRTQVAQHGLGAPELPTVEGRSGMSSHVQFYYAHAVQQGRASRERDFDGEMRGIFTVTFLEALRKAPPNQVGRVNGSVIRNFVHHNIDRKAGDVQVDPPDIEGPRSGEIVFAERSDGVRPQVAFVVDPLTAGEELRIFTKPEDEPTVVPLAGQRGTIALAPGFYKAGLKKAGRETLFEVGLDDVEVTI